MIRRPARFGFYFCALVLCASFAQVASAANVTLPSAGRVTVELITSDAAFRNTLSVASPVVAVALTGCKLEPAGGLAGTHILSENNSQRGCRVELDSDPATGGIQPFASGTVFELNFCAQTDADDQCEFTWSSDPADNSDGDDHVQTVVLSAGVFRLSWEDQEDLGDSDFNDLIAVLRISNDSDGDGLWDDWETTGIDSTGDGMVDLVLDDADPMHKDIYVEIDWMDCAVAGSDCPMGDNHNHQPKQAAIDAVVDAFEAGNVTNPDMLNGIDLHIDVSNSIAHQSFMIIPNACFTGTAGTGFDAIKSNAANFGNDTPRRFAYHYNLWTHRQTTGDLGSSGCGELPGNDFQVTLGAWNIGMGDLDGDGLPDAQVGTVMEQAGTLMHELGHNLNLQHGGDDWTNFKPNFLSVMNYSFQTGGIPPTDPDAGGPLTGRIDYSTATLPTLTENNLSEPAGIGDGADNTTFTCAGGAAGAGTGMGAIDWNCDADGGVDTGLSTDINADQNLTCVREGTDGDRDTAAAGDDVVNGVRIFEGPNRQCDTTAAAGDVQWRPLGPLDGFWDWNNIKYDFQNSNDFEDGIHTFQELQLRELDFETYVAELAPDPALAMTADPDPVVTGSDITYDIQLSNLRAGAAMNVSIADALPASTTFVSCASTGQGVCSGTGNARVIDFAALAGSSTETVTLVATANCEVPDGTLIANEATVTSTTIDSEASNNVAGRTITASNPPPEIVGLSASPAVLWPPNHEMIDVQIGYDIVDNCGPVACTLSVASNEPPNGPGDGNTSSDWQVLDDHHVRLRAERSGGGSGRIYTITTTCSDTAGGSSNESVAVAVPKSQGK